MSRNSKVLTGQLPRDRAVQWLPVGDSYHVVAALRPGGGLPVYITQDTLVRLNAVGAATTGERAVGLLVGARYRCPDTGTNFVVVDSLDDETYVLIDDESPRDVLAEALRTFKESATHAAVGWYFASGLQPEQASRELAHSHAALFDETSIFVVLTHRGSEVSGVVFRYERANQKAYRLPFLELLDAHVAPDPRGKPTCLAWPAYLATEPTAGPLIGDAGRPRAPRRVRVASEPSSGHHPPNNRRATAWSDRENPSVSPAGPPSPAPSATRSIELATSVPMPAIEPGAGAPDESRAAPRAIADPPSVSSSGSASSELRARLSAVPDVEVPISERRESLTSRESAPPMSPGRQRPGARATAPRAMPIESADDATVGDPVSRYLRVAEADGFFGIEVFEAEAAPGLTTNLLHDPYTGLLLVIHASGATVIESVLHYNIRPSDPVALQTAFSGHRDLESGTMYVRESIADGLRHRAAQLREEGRLVPEWTVKPPIYLVGPHEWEALVGHDPLRAAQQIQTVNRDRVSALPEIIAARYGFTTR